MKPFLPLAIGLLLALPATAQRQGMSNQDAPTVSATITFKDGTKVSCEYLSITWAQGRWFERLKSNDERRKAHNDSAPKGPLGKFSTTADLNVAGQAVPAGEYSVYFTFTDKLEWQINLGNDKKTVTITLPLQDSPTESSRLLLGLHAVDARTAGLYFSFGKQNCDLQLARGAKDAGKTGEGEGKG